MAEIKINLSNNELDAINEMLGGPDKIESHLKNLASAHEENELDDTFKKKTKAEKQALLES